MPTTTLVNVLSALPSGGAVGAFNVVQIEHIEAILAGAVDAGAPVVLQISENAVRYHGALAPISRAALAAADAAPVPVVVHLDHASDTALVEEALDLGFTSIMYDGSALPVEENLRRTAVVAERAHSWGVSIEAEIGEVGGKDGVHAPGARTRPAEAASFVERTGIDAVAVAVGSSHAMTTRTARLDLGLIAQIAAAVPVPLVLHGSSGVPDDQLRAAVVAGMSKVNISTHLNRIFTDVLRGILVGDPALVDTRKYLGPARDAVAQEVERLVRLLWL